MLVSIQDLRSIQERCEIGELVQRLDVSIDRLTVIWDTDTGSLRRIFKNLKQAISTRVDSFEIHDNVRDDVFTLAKDFNEYDSINIIFFHFLKFINQSSYRKPNHIIVVSADSFYVNSKFPLDSIASCFIHRLPCFYIFQKLFS